MKALGPHDLHKMLDAFEDKSAQAVATFAYSEGPGHKPILFQGRTDVRPPSSLLFYIMISC
jgi:inosine triphosphate pyrophosphatase